MRTNSLAWQAMLEVQAELAALPECPSVYAIPPLTLRIIEDGLEWQGELLRAWTPLTRPAPPRPDRKDCCVTLATPRGVVRLEAIPSAT